MAAKLVFEPQTVEMQVGKSQTVDVRLTSDVEVIGTDLVVRYDGQVLELTEIHGAGVFPQEQQIINPNEGQAVVNFFHNFGESFKGNEKIATLTFLPKQVSEQSVVTLEYIAGRSRDSNVTGKNGKDVLNSVGSLEFVVKEAEVVAVTEEIASPTAVVAAGMTTNNVRLPFQQSNDYTIGLVFLISGMLLVVGGFLIQLVDLLFSNKRSEAPSRRRGKISLR